MLHNDYLLPCLIWNFVRAYPNQHQYAKCEASTNQIEESRVHIFDAVDVVVTKLIKIIVNWIVIISTKFQYRVIDFS